MSGKTLFPTLLIIILFASFFHGNACLADAVMPQAPAFFSWLPHGYGATMHVNNPPAARMEGLYGFRTAPQHIGCWSYPLWGWDVNGYYHGPNVPCPDPVMCQLPIGLIYPVNSPVLPPRGDPRTVPGMAN